MGRAGLRADVWRLLLEVGLEMDMGAIGSPLQVDRGLLGLL